MSPVDTSSARVRKQIRARLKARGLKQTAFAASIGKSKAWISQILAGERGVPLDALDDIAGGFDISPSELLDALHLDTYDDNTATGPRNAHTPAVTTRLLRRQQQIVNRVLGLESALDQIAAERLFLEYLDSNLRALVKDARKVRDAVHGQSANRGDRAPLDRTRKSATGTPTADSRERK